MSDSCTPCHPTEHQSQNQIQIPKPTDHEIVDVEEIFPPVVLTRVHRVLDVVGPGAVGEVLEEGGVEADHCIRRAVDHRMPIF